MALEIHEDRIGPVRGLIATHNHRGKPYDPVDLNRWMRVVRLVLKADKIDVLADAPGLERVPELLDTARSLDARVSLRVASDVSPEALGPLKDAGLFDVFVLAAGERFASVDPWLDACRDAGLPVRLQLQAPFSAGLDGSQAARRFAEHGVVAVNFALSDPFTTETPCSEKASRETLTSMCDLARALEDEGVEANLVGLPFCLVDEDSFPRVVNRPQFHLDHQQYERNAYDLALRLFGMGPVRAKKTLLILLGRYTSYPNPIDSKLLPWLLDRPWVRARVWAWHKVTRHLRLGWSVPKAVDTTRGKSDDAARGAGAFEDVSDPECRACGLRRICDHDQARYRRLLPGVAVERVEGEEIIGPLHFSRGQPKHYDEIDAPRHDRDSANRDLAAQANEIMAARPPDRELSSFDYETEGQYSLQLAGSLSWFSWTNTEKVSTALARLEPPFTLSAMFGGGIADYIGFSLGRHCKLVCPMEAYAHRVALHVTQDGRYVLLRDGEPVRPVEFAGTHYVPVRLGSVLEPRVSIWNIDGRIGTQAVSIWTERAAPDETARDVTYSIVVVSTRFARRLQATLWNLAHQAEIDLAKLEVIVAHVPGIDATGDVIKSISEARPDLRIVRSCFAEHHATSKGLMINESARLASGDWIVLLDADILIAPTMFAAMERLPESVSFVIPDGRKMLSRETTSRILLGDIEPWRQWDELMSGPGEHRRAEADGVPIGYCQCARKACFDQVQYEEMAHFEGADWRFGKDMRERYGQEHRLTGLPVLHMDHGGSQWYGTQHHR